MARVRIGASPGADWLPRSRPLRRERWLCNRLSGDHQPPISPLGISNDRVILRRPVVPGHLTARTTGEVAEWLKALPC